MSPARMERSYETTSFIVDRINKELRQCIK